MATTQPDNRPKLTAPVRAALGAALGALRARIRLYAWFEGLACAAALLGIAFWLSLAVDWYFEPSVALRRVILMMVGVGLVGVLVQRIGMRAFARLSDANMATLLERRFAVLDDALLTAVLLTERESIPDECNATLLEQTCDQAAGRIEQLCLGEVFNPKPLRRSLTAATLLGISIGLFAVQWPGAFDVWRQRTVLLGEGLWPRDTRLSVEGFENRAAKVARGADFTLIARADMRKPFVPRVVEVRYRAEGGASSRAIMSRLGEARRGVDPFQEYSHTFQGVLAPIRFDVVGGDDRVSGLRIEVVDSPTISRLLLDCEFPAYVGRPPRTLPHVGAMQLPMGTRITARATANKDLTGVQIDTLTEEEDPSRSGTRESSETERPASDFLRIPLQDRDFQHELPPLERDVTLLFTLSDTDGITAREPVRLPLVAIEDQPPQLRVQLDGIGSAVTPDAILPAGGRITDDHGVGSLRFIYTIDQGRQEQQPIRLPEGDTTELKLAAAMQVDRLKLKPGQRLSLGVEAADRCDLRGRPNLGTSEQWTLDIVTPEQLRVLLESRELVLRQRFERIVEEVVESRDLLAELDGPEERGDAERADAERADAPPESSVPDPRVRIRQVIQSGRKNAHETLGVAVDFDDIRLQLINNRIDTEPLKDRLKNRIADPLVRIAKEQFPELERRLGHVSKRLEEGKPAEKTLLDPALQQIDTILLEMRRVLDSMIELEDFNEAVELLREIIRLQKELDEKTRERHKNTLRDLLGEL